MLKSLFWVLGIVASCFRGRVPQHIIEMEDNTENADDYHPNKRPRVENRAGGNRDELKPVAVGAIAGAIARPAEVP